MEDFDLICAIGSGTCGEVSKMKHKPSGRVFAVKVSGNISFACIVLLALCLPLNPGEEHLEETEWVMKRWVKPKFIYSCSARVVGQNMNVARVHSVK